MECEAVGAVSQKGIQGTQIIGWALAENGAVPTIAQLLKASAKAASRFALADASG